MVERQIAGPRNEQAGDDSRIYLSVLWKKRRRMQIDLKSLEIRESYFSSLGHFPRYIKKSCDPQVINIPNTFKYVQQ